MAYIAKKEADKVRLEYLDQNNLKRIGLVLLTVFYTPEKVEELFKAGPIGTLYKDGEITSFKDSYEKYTDIEEFLKKDGRGYIYYFDGEKWLYDYINSREDFDNMSELIIEMTI